MHKNLTLERLRSGQVVLGAAMQHFRSAEVPRVFAAAGFDYVFIDGEHTGFDLETIQDFIAASVPAGITPIVRVSELLYSQVARYLDVGAQGIILPRVESARLLEDAISWTKFPPRGKRGFGVMAPLLNYEQRSVAEIIEHSNENTLVVVQFETRFAMEHCDELLSVEGIDVAMIGPSDLSISMGVPGEFEHPIMVELISRFVHACNAHGVFPAIHCRSSVDAKRWIERGMRFVGCGSDLGLLLENAKATVMNVRAAVTPLAKIGKQ